jgi:iron-sulfur cluster repair protein YtfE (RIC family)
MACRKDLLLAGETIHMNRREIEAHPGHNFVIAKIYETHHGLRELTKRIDELGAELATPVGANCLADPAWRQAMTSTYDIFMRVMHAHHGTEDEVIFPYMSKKYGFDSSALDAQHKTLLEAMSKMRSTLATALGKDGAGDAPRAAVTSQARALRESVVAHLDEEEATAVVALLQLTRQDIQIMFGGAF